MCLGPGPNFATSEWQSNVLTVTVSASPAAAYQGSCDCWEHKSLLSFLPLSLSEIIFFLTSVLSNQTFNTRRLCFGKNRQPWSLDRDKQWHYDFSFSEFWSTYMHTLIYFSLFLFLSFSLYISSFVFFSSCRNFTAIESNCVKLTWVNVHCKLFTIYDFEIIFYMGDCY